MTEPVVMIDDPRVLAIEIRDNGEQLVDVGTLGVEVSLSHAGVGSSAETRFSCRASVADRLAAANRILPDGLSISLAEGHRPLETQTAFWNSNLSRVRLANPNLSDTEAAAETAKFVAPPWITPPHSTGGAVDVVLMEGKAEVPMGCGLNERCIEMETFSDAICASHQESRAVLLDAMTSVGFVNYGHEWWHYSYGDRYWAYMTGAAAAEYGPA